MSLRNGGRRQRRASFTSATRARTSKSIVHLHLAPQLRKPIRYLAPVPGAPERASTKYDVAQAMSFVATQRKNAEERLAWQNVIPCLLERLSASSGAWAR